MNMSNQTPPPAAAPNDHPADQQITGQFPTAEQIAQAQTRERAKQSWLGCLTVILIFAAIFIWLKC
jgi:hypothetical protein